MGSAQWRSSWKYNVKSKEKSNFIVEKPVKYHLSQVTKVNISSDVML